EDDSHSRHHDNGRSKYFSGSKMDHLTEAFFGSTWLEYWESSTGVYRPIYLDSKSFSNVPFQLAECNTSDPLAMGVDVTVPLIIAIDGHSIVDVTRRYEDRWSVRRKIRTRLFNETELEILLHSVSSNECIGEKERNTADQALLRSKAESESIPGRVSEFKNHPLFVLEKDLLKFEHIHPRVSLGRIREHEIFPRSSVQILKSEQKWIQDLRQLKPKQTPIKMVKKRTRPSTPNKRSLFSYEPPTEEQQQLGLFGIWQTEPYKPGQVRNGFVPRNRFGNVYLFDPSMLPIGAVHLREMPGLPRIAKKLGISCVPAVVGWTVRRNLSHPTEDGFVVPAESEAALTQAWLEVEQKKHQDYVIKIVKRWKVLARRLQIRQAVYARFSSPRSGRAEAEPVDILDDRFLPQVIQLSEPRSSLIVLSDSSSESGPDELVDDNEDIIFLR
ncbi:MAG: hypothetical protein K2X47_07295, partial [Bdellovibrionales bacterium]|nr:hypothetical protein [Bdellovibrionales bacterium]